MPLKLPSHLKRYIVEQDYARYTPVDQAVWRYIMLQLTDFLAEYAHPCYLEGLKKTGIEIDHIPEISKMSEKLAEFGWQAAPVSGFIPPAAFMELQAHGVLPIASDLRAPDHIMYTPAPDIVHEAAGHAPILVEPAYAAYLKAYAQVASKAIISREDMDQYEAIRLLSDLKEDPDSTREQVTAAERRLTEVTAQITTLSEAALLGRMNWWTAEYGLIGTLENPKIFGAGLLSSIGEARACLGAKVKKLPLTVDCIDYAYDITEQQPQLFVTPDFNHLEVVLNQLAERLAFRTGGLAGLKKALEARTVNTVQLDSGLQVSGVLTKTIATKYAELPVYLQFSGPTQLSVDGRELPGHAKSYHKDGFGSPVGRLAQGQLPSLNVGDTSHLRFESGVEVEGRVKSVTRNPKTDALILISFTDCTVTYDKQVLFNPSWGTFDMAVGQSIPSVVGGPADRLAYGETDDFVAKVIPRRQWADKDLRQQRLYDGVASLRRASLDGEIELSSAHSKLAELSLEVSQDFTWDWLIRLELLEISQQLNATDTTAKLESEIAALAKQNADTDERISDGLRVMKSRAQ